MTLRRGLILVFGLLLSLVLSSCQLWASMLGVPGDCDKYRQRIDFANDLRIVRGSWEGVVKDYPSEGLDTELRLELTATYEDAESYAIAGTFTLGDEPAKRLEGGVSGGCFETYVQSLDAVEILSDSGEIEPASIPPSPGMGAEVRDDDGSLLWTLRATWGGFIGEQPPPEASLAGRLLREGERDQAYDYLIERSSPDEM